MENLAEIIKNCKQKIYNEQVLGYGVQPVEAVDTLLYELRDFFISWKSQIQEAINFVPEDEY